MKLDVIYNEDCLGEKGMKRLPDKSIDMILADVPYGTTACKWDKIIPLESMWEQVKRAIKPNGAIVMTASQPFTTDLINSNRKWFKYEWIWNKMIGKNFLLAKKMPLKCHENILIFYKKQPIYNPQKVDLKNIETIKRNGRNRYTAYESNHYGKIKLLARNTDIYKFPVSIINLKAVNKSNQFIKKDTNLHDTQKPVALFEYLIKTYTNEGEVVLDFAIGSGTTAIACVNLDRHFIGFEISKKYCEIANKRLENIQLELIK